MASLTLGDLTELKAFLLPESLRSGTDYDAAITALGKGLAAAFERHCSRLFAYAEDDTFQCDAQRLSIILPRYPVTEIASIKISSDASVTWTTLTGVIAAQDLSCGLIRLEAVQGTPDSQLKVTYSGGYYVDSTDDSTSGQPAGSTALPSDLKLAWLLQCEHAWQQRDKLGVSIAAKPQAASALADLDLLPTVLSTLKAYRRFAIL